MHTDDLSVHLKIRNGRAVEAHAVPRSYREDYTKTKLSRALVTIDADTGLQIVLKLRKTFDFSQSKGLRVAIALGPKKPGSFFPAKVQYWWIPFTSLETSKELEITWNEHWNWNIEDASNSTNGDKVTALQSVDFEIARNLYNCEWRPLTDAPEGCIAIHVGSSIAPPVTLAVGKGPALYVPLESIISHSDWFRPPQPKEHEVYAFEFRITDPSEFEFSAASTASKPSEEVSKRSSVEMEKQPYLEPKRQNDKVISASTGEYTRRSKRIASSARVDYTVKKRRSVTLEEPSKSSSKHPTNKNGGHPTLSNRLVEYAGTKRPANVDRVDSAETLLAEQQNRSDTRARNEIDLPGSSHEPESQASLNAASTSTQPSLVPIGRDSSVQPAQVTAGPPSSAADTSVRENEQREIRRARLDYELLMAQNRANELRRAIELEERFGVSFRD